MFKRTTLFAIALALVAASCSSSDVAGTTSTSEPATTTFSTTSTSTTTTLPPDDGFPVTVEAANGAVTIDARPERIVSISPTSTEVLFAIGAGEQVIAVDSLSNYPPEAPITELSAWTPSIEAIAEYDPDLVFISFDPGDLIVGLETLGIPVILHGTASSLEDAYAQWEQTGAATGHIAEAVDVVSDTQSRLLDAAESIANEAQGLTYYYEIEDLLYTTTSASFIGQVIALTGLSNIADEAADPDGFGYPQLSQEFIVESDPNLILLANTVYGGQSLETVAARPGWGSISAVTSGAVVELNDDIASRWSPRVVELLDAVVEAVSSLPTADA
ncbi:MAG: ABC transporter substrate-binding protein [Acidimicrobiia bacterium]|nr:ABC transporter substrate-binding protein [Acidimicrobiia bacterium]